MAEYTLPAINQGDWTVGTDVGVNGGIFQYRPGGASERTSLRNVVAEFGADNTQATSARAAIQVAINAATSGQVVYCPAGRYLIDGLLSIPTTKSNITIRGDGPSTVFYFSGNSYFSAGASGPAYNSNPQTLTGTRTKGTSVLSVASSSAYGVGELATVLANNEEDNTRIQAGAAPTWSQKAFRAFRRMCCRVVAVGSGTITIDPPLPWDLTDVGGRIERGGSTHIDKVGFEDFNCEFNHPAAFPIAAIQMAMAIECWVYNVNVPNWVKVSDNGSMVIWNNSYKCEIRHCTGISTTTAQSDGFLQPSNVSSCLIEDNIFINWDYGFYSSGRTFNCVIAYNFFLTAQSGSRTGINMSHGGGDGLNLVEGNFVNNVGVDSYHGFASHFVLHRNWCHGTNATQTLRGFQLALRRGTRNVVLSGNVFGIDGWSDDVLSFGNPNLGNSNYTGTTNTTTGDFWDDWGVTGTLTTRTGNNAGVVTCSGGAWATAVANGCVVSVLWGGKTSGINDMTVVSRTGNVITLSGGSPMPGSLEVVLPPEGTSFDLVQVNTLGFQELDLAVEATTTLVNNYRAAQSGTGSIDTPLDPGDTLPDSFCYAARPSWWPTSLAWPAVDPDVPTFDYETLPAGYRYFNGADAPSGSAEAPVITLDPVTQSVNEGDDVTLSANATGNPTPEWTWTKNGTLIPSATTRFLALLDVQGSDSASYAATATNSAGYDVSATAVLTVITPSEPSTGNPRGGRTSGAALMFGAF